MYATIAELPEDFRMALVAIDVLGLSYHEAARALRVREATITTRLFRARQAVTKSLADTPLPGERAAGTSTEGRTPSREPIGRSRREQIGPSGVVPSRESP